MQSEGHFFSGRYKSILIDGHTLGYLKTACDYVHLNPVRAKLLSAQERLLAYPWSSWGWYLSAPEHRPQWMRVDRLLGEHGLREDTPEARAELERRVEASRVEEEDGARWVPLRRGWCLGSEPFRVEALARMAGRLGENHAGELHREQAQAKAEQIIAEELGRLGWGEESEKRPSETGLGGAVAAGYATTVKVDHPALADGDLEERSGEVGQRRSTAR